MAIDGVSWDSLAIDRDSLRLFAISGDWLDLVGLLGD